VEERPARLDEWYVPKFGSLRFRAFVGMMFLPYTLMNAAYVMIGSTLPQTVHWDRAIALVVVYLLAVGLTAHAFDAMGPNKPWGDVLSHNQLAALATVSLTAALAIGAYYSISYAPLLLVIGTVELFFLFAYNLELFGSRFHSKPWFAFSWGFLPVQAGYLLQTGTLDTVSLIGGFFGLGTAYAEASASRPYKTLKLAAGTGGGNEAIRYERMLKAIVSSVLLACALLILFRL